MSPRRITRCSKQKEKGGKRERERERERKRKRRREVPNLKLLRNFDHVVYLELPQSTVKEDLITNYY